MRKPDDYRQAAAEMDAEGDHARASDTKQRYHDLAEAFRNMADSLEASGPDGAGEHADNDAEGMREGRVG
jgi:hypothetical protein